LLYQLSYISEARHSTNNQSSLEEVAGHFKKYSVLSMRFSSSSLTIRFKNLRNGTGIQLLKAAYRPHCPRFTGRPGGVIGDCPEWISCGCVMETGERIWCATVFSTAQSKNPPVFLLEGFLIKA
jgi:hypothetical protein